ncbi:MAG: bifunctional metallophosphatase/5'-nucleotidase [Burkholderiales bacterium]|nr:bifunctional metallophosphatase/5'-nucleotidase [Burkholderiales bacterium]
MPGRLRLIRGTANPAGGLDALYLLTGDAHTGPVTAIDIDPGIVLSTFTGTRRLRLFHFNDLHNYLQAPEAGRPQLFSRIVHRHRAARGAAAPDEIVLLLSGGDDHTGTPLDELLGWTAEDLLIDPAYAAYSAAGVDAATLGNHDLDRGSAVLAAGIRTSAVFPILSANIHGAAALVAGRDYFPGAIAVARGLRIGLLGLTTAIDTRTATPYDPHLQVAGPLATLRHVLPALAALTDVVIVMSHCGYGLDDRAAAAAAACDFLAEGDVAIARLAATLTERPVLVLGGHSHTVLNAQGFGPATLIDGVPIIQAGGQGSHVGEFVATFAPASTRQDWTANATLHPLRGSPRGAGVDSGATAPPPFDAGFEADVIAPLVARMQARMDEKLAINDGGAEVSQATTLRQRYAGECVLANFVSDALVARSRDFPQGPADLAIVNATAIAAGLPEGSDITFKDMYRMLPFADCLQLCRMRGSDLLAILRSNAARILRPEELAGPGAVDAGGYVSRGFVHFSRSLRYTIRLQGSAAQAAIADATLDGVPLEQLLDRTLTVVFTNYLGAGGYREAWNGNPIGAGVPGNLASFDLRGLPRHDTGLVFRNEIITHAKAVGCIGRTTGAVLDGRLRIV